MPAPEPHIDLDSLDFTKIEADADGVRKVIPHRHEMEMLSAILFTCRDRQLIVGYKDVEAEPFWARGHFPGLPLMPGVLQCECAAQLTAYYTTATGVNEGQLLGLAGIENARFRKAVRPGDRLVLLGKGIRVKSRMTQFNVQGFVNGELVFQTDIIGIPLGKTEALFVA